MSPTEMSALAQTGSPEKEVFNILIGTIHSCNNQLAMPILPYKL